MNDSKISEYLHGFFADRPRETPVDVRPILINSLRYDVLANAESPPGRFRGVRSWLGRKLARAAIAILGVVPPPSRGSLRSSLADESRRESEWAKSETKGVMA